MVAMNVNEFIQNCRPQYTKAKHGLKIIQEPKTIRRDDYKEDDDGTYKVTMRRWGGNAWGTNNNTRAYRDMNLKHWKSEIMASLKQCPRINKPSYR